MKCKDTKKGLKKRKKFEALYKEFCNNIFADTQNNGVLFIRQFNGHGITGPAFTKNLTVARLQLFLTMLQQEYVSQKYVCHNEQAENLGEGTFWYHQLRPTFNAFIDNAMSLFPQRGLVLAFMEQGCPLVVMSHGLTGAELAASFYWEVHHYDPNPFMYYFRVKQPICPFDFGKAEKTKI